MSEIHVATSDLRNGSQNLNGAADEIMVVHNQVSRASLNAGNDYDGQLRQALEGITGGTSQVGLQLQRRAIDLGYELLSRASGFETANEAARSAVFGATTAYTNFIETTPTLGYLSVLSKLIVRALPFWNMGGLIGGFLTLFFYNNKAPILTPISDPQVEKLSPPQNLRPINVPYYSQWNEKNQNGANNCGPASVTMAINKYDKNIEYTDVVSRIRGNNNSSGPTNFNSAEVDKILKENELVRMPVTNISDLEENLNKNHPVIILVDNSKYVREENGRSAPYPNTSGYLQKHIVVVTGYEKDSAGNIVAVYINDPLSVKPAGPNSGRMVADPDTGKNFRVPINDFNSAAGKQWNASAITPQS